MWTKDASVCPLPFDEAAFASRAPLRIGYFEALPELRLFPTPAVQRAIREARASGHRNRPRR